MKKGICFINIHEVVGMTGISRALIYEMAKRGEFPKQVQITQMRVGWVKSEIEEWMIEKIRKRDQQ